MFTIVVSFCFILTWSFQSKSYIRSETAHVGMAKDQDDETHKNISSLAVDILLTSGQLDSSAVSNGAAADILRRYVS